MLSAQTIENYVHEPSTNVLKTVSRMKRVLNDPQQVVYGRSLAETIMREHPYSRNRLDEMRNLFHGVVRRTRYLRDIQGAETLKTPKRIHEEIRNEGLMVGDCDDVSMFLASALKGAGFKTRFVVSTTKGNPYDTYNHIWVQSEHNGKWYDLDGTLKQPFKVKPFRKIMVFPENR